MTMKSQLTSLLKEAMHSPAARFYVAVWFVAAAYMTTTGRVVSVMAYFGILVAVLVLCGVTIWMTEPDNASSPNSSSSKKAPVLQLIILLLIILVTGYEHSIFHGANLPHLPFWRQAQGILYEASQSLFGRGDVFWNSTKYFVIPLVLLLALGARFRSLGLSAGHRIWRVTGLWCGIPIVILFMQLVVGQVGLIRIGNQLLSHFLQNGFFEEFLFRGALQTRLRMLTSRSWAIVIQGLLFGVWHLGLEYKMTGHSDIIAALATTILSSIGGIAFGVIFERTRNLIASSVFHIVGNAVS